MWLRSDPETLCSHIKQRLPEAWINNISQRAAAWEFSFLLSIRYLFFGKGSKSSLFLWGRAQPWAQFSTGGTVLKRSSVCGTRLASGDIQRQDRPHTWELHHIHLKNPDDVINYWITQRSNIAFRDLTVHTVILCAADQRCNIFIMLLLSLSSMSDYCGWIWMMCILYLYPTTLSYVLLTIM